VSDAAPVAPGRLLDALVARAAGEGRTILALAGPPGSGKSTLAEALAARLNAVEEGVAAVLPMDGFHYDDLLLVPLGWRARKGAPHTFDAGGLRATLARLRARDEEAVAVPVFDRAIEIARAGARLIPRRARVIIVEGNWLLLRDAPWSDLAPLYDLTALVALPEAALRARLTARWEGFGLAPDEVRAKVEGNDLPNAARVAAGSATPDFLIDGRAAL
jgi:pantothenate kinase